MEGMLMEGILMEGMLMEGILMEGILMVIDMKDVFEGIARGNHQ